MTSKYSIARNLIEQLQQHAESHSLDPTDVQEATMILLIQALRESRGSDSMRIIALSTLKALWEEHPE